MAHSRSAKKRIRRNERARVVNKNRMSRIRTFIKKVENALGAGDTAGAETAFKQAEPEIQRGVTKGLLHKNTAARKVSRLSARIKRAKAA